ncbi:hypothetical protein EHN07_03820 [Buttiauxella warmboldiae]|uniref:Uncharacterized protein n=1 Tax=Buttiauxella warmboldiae TaxID=82993 RepID=A0A3N5DX24_9ENTR|nr:hypothetical protein [Buttiauxella warmboldiae]RPH30240.1 hypothetical protein EHN07_03820 [Buttiauxella warmboldiae]
MKKIFSTICLMSILVGCATEKSITPTIDSSPRAEVNLEYPLLISVFDGRTSNRDDNGNAEESIKNSLTKIYGKNLQWISDFDKVPNGRTAIRIRLIILGANFGSRIVSSSSYQNAVSTARISATDGWGTVVGVADGNTVINSGTMTTEGWWNGTAWVDFVVEDNSDTKKVEFTTPLVAEHQENNTWGYSSGHKATEVAWNSVSTQILRSIDAVLRKTSN